MKYFFLTFHKRINSDFLFMRTNRHPGIGASKRMEALSDGIFAIAATLLVLEIRVPQLEDPSRMTNALIEILPSLVGFIFSFLNILIFWVNHDSIGKVINFFDAKLTYLNIIFLMMISLIPFTTALVSRYPFNLIAVSIYGLIFLLASIVACLMYYHVAFTGKLMHENITLRSRKKIWKRIIPGPFLFAVAIALGLIHVYIPIIIYILVPMLYLVLPKIEFDENVLS
jgi:uncharacterized membrane protein